MQGIASDNAPHPSVVVPHFAAGALVLPVILILLLFHPDALTQHYFNPKLLAITHLCTLAWISMVIFGALYQIIPVILEVRLHSELLAKWSFAGLLSGTVMLSISFWYMKTGVWMIGAAVLLLLTVAGFSLNVLLSARQSSKVNLEARFIRASVYWLLFTALAGLLLAINLFRAFLPVSHLEFLKLHAHAGIAGWFLLLIMGVGSKLIPMFLVVHHLDKRKLNFAFWTINAALVLMLTGFYAGIETAVTLGGLLLISGLVAFIWYLAEAYRHRVKANLDAGMQQTALAFGLIVVPVLLFFIFQFSNKTKAASFGALPAVYGSSIFLGFVTALILGQTFKTLPFIIWLQRYRKMIGKAKVPMPKDLYSHKLVKLQMWFYTAGFLTLLAGMLLSQQIVIQSGASLLLGATLFYSYNVFRIIFHKSKAYAVN
jgi:hypothetical protein